MQDVDICNQALALCAADPIASLNEISPLGTFCKQVYPGKRDYLMGIYRWVFATQVQKLTQVDVNSIPADKRPLTYAFSRPSDIQGVANAFRDQPDICGARSLYVMEVDNRYWCSESSVWIEYTAKRDESRWPSWFVELVKIAFAADIARKLQQATLARDLEFKAFGNDGEGGLYAQARASDARAVPQRTLFGVDDGPLVNVRQSAPCFGWNGQIAEGGDAY